MSGNLVIITIHTGGRYYIFGILNITAIAKKLCRSVVIEEHFEFAICAAHTVKISGCVQGPTSINLVQLQTY
jgi:hypothetical protein